ncbi:hypothetical protein, partial [Flavilitoribacter nigricans]|uniref:hypothetical protein n=1 Tax=Flavilitoribacter nigricans TaxID=70997 RepID=UPI001472AE52
GPYRPRIINLRIYNSTRETANSQILYRRLSPGEFTGTAYIQVYGDNTIRDVVDVKSDGFHFNPKYGPSRFDPILPKLRTKLAKVVLNETIQASEEIIRWSVYADNAEERNAEMKISAIKRIEKFENE